MMKQLLPATLALAALAGCGGGGGSGGGTAPPPRQSGIAIVAGDASNPGSADGAAAAARFSNPRGIALDAEGNLYVADQGNKTIRKLSAAGQVSTIAGAAGVGGQLDGLGGAARFEMPTGLAIDTAGNLFVTDLLKVRKISPAGLVTTVATLPVGEMVDSRSMGQFLAGGVAVARTGELYITNGIGTRRISAAGATTIIEGVDSASNVSGTRLFQPRGITVDATGTLWVADLARTISKAGADGALVRVAGSPNVTGDADGSGSAASFNVVNALSADANGNLYAADHYNNLIRKIPPAGVVSTVAGTRGASSLQAGPLPGTLAGVGGVAVDRNGDLFATSGNAVIKVTLP